VEAGSGFLLLVALASVLAGVTASIAGFGIGSLLTPLFALRLGTPTAIAAVMVPHAAATVLRAWRLRRAVDWPLFYRFGIASALGGLAGALLFTRLGGPTLTRVLGALLVLTALSGLTGWASRVHLPRWGAMLLGAASGFFGGVAGNQGGIRAGALLGVGLGPAAFVATSTMSGVIVDVARAPVYLHLRGDAVLAAWPVVSVATLGALVGTLAGERALFGLSPERFRVVVAALVGALGLWLLVR
jgi:uncharacterized membrane protein YfcA